MIKYQRPPQPRSPGLSKRDIEKLETVDPRLADIVSEVARFFSLFVVCGFRDKEAQNEAYESGNSGLKWPDSKHNKQPSLAVDLAPRPLDWDDKDRFLLLAGAVIGVAGSKGYRLKWGGNWKGWPRKYDNGAPNSDLGHFELVV